MEDTANIALQKKELRTLIRRRKEACGPDVLARSSEALMRRLSLHPRFLSAKTLLIYNSLPDEPCTRFLLDSSLGHKRVLLPVVEGDELRVKEYTGSANLNAGAFGILEPEGAPFTDYSVVDLIVVPGVAFDAAGGRLGRGRGYYDRFLKNSGLAGVYKIGIAFSFQLVDRVPVEQHDIRMDEVLTEL